MSHRFDPAASFLDDLTALQSLFSGAVVCVDDVASAALETSNTAEQLITWGACNVIGVHQARDIELAIHRIQSIHKVVFLLGAHHAHSRGRINSALSLLPRDRTISLAFVVGCVLDLKAAGDHIADQGQFDSFVQELSSFGHPTETYEMPGLSMVHLTSFASLLGVRPMEEAKGAAAAAAGEEDEEEQQEQTAALAKLGAHDDDKSNTHVLAIVLKLIMVTCARGFKTEVFALGTQAREIASEFVVLASTMLKRTENMDKLSLLIVDRLLDVRECFRPSQPLVKRDLSFKDCDHHADERREASAATTAHLTSSLKPSCPVYVRDLDYETSQNRLVAKLRRQSLELLRSERRTVVRSGVRLGEAKESQVMDIANHIEDQNWRKFVASVVQQQGRVKHTESIRAVFRNIESDIEQSVESGTELGLADIVDDVMSKAKKLAASYQDQSDLHTIGKEAFALCVRSMIICQEPLSQESLRTMVHFCWSHGLSEWLQTPGKSGENMKEDDAISFLVMETLYLLQRMQKEQLVAWSGRQLIPTISSYLLRKKDIPGMVHIPASIGGLLNSSLGRIGFQKKTIPSMRDTVIIYVTGGVASHEIQEFQRILENESQSPIRLFLLSERVDVIDQRIYSLFDALRPLSS